MLSSVGLEVMKSTNPELGWKLVKKGRRSKKSVARSLNSIVKVENSTSPQRVGDFSGSDSDKFGEVIIKQATSGKSKNVPLKKRTHLLQSPSTPLASSLRDKESSLLRTHSSSPLLEGGVQLHYPSYSSGQRPSNMHLKGIGNSAKAGRINCGFGGVSPCNQVEGEYDCAGDFSGIELLATAATSIVDGVYGADLKDVLPANTSIQKNSDASSSAIMPEEGLKNSESVHSLSNNDVLGGYMDSQDKNSVAASQSLSTSPEDDTMPKVSRKHWDLNTPMDAWGEQYDDSIAEDTLGDASVGLHMEEMEKHYGDHLLSDPSSLKEEDKSTLAPEDGICREPSHIVVNLLESPNSIYSHISCETDTTLSQSREKDTDEKNSIQALNHDTDMKFLNQVTRPDIIAGMSPFSKLCCTCGRQMSEEKNNGLSGSATTGKDGDCCSNISECDRTTAQDGTCRGTDEVKSCAMDASEFTTDLQLKDKEVSMKTCVLLGTFALDAQPVASTDSNKGMHGAFHSSSMMADCNEYLGLAEPDTKHDEDCNLPEEESKRTMEVTCKSSITGTQRGKPTTVGRMRFAVDGQQDPNVSQDNKGHRDDLTGFQEGYDSSYEDGELRGSLLYSWEGLENECVDYESDGRNGDSSDAADYYLGSEIVEGRSEGTHGIRRSLPLKVSPEGKNESGPANYPLKKHDVKDKSGNNEMAGKASNAGSGSTVEQCIEMAMEENAAAYRSQLVDDKDAVNVTYIDECASKAIKGKLQSQGEGRSSADPSNGKGVFFVQQSRPCRIAGAYPRAERDICPDRYLGRYKSAPASGEGDRAHQWTSWFPKRRHQMDHQGGEGRNFTRPRNKTGESINKIDGVDCHEPRQTNYLSKGLHRPFIRRSPAERDDYFGVGRRVPLTRGVGNYRSPGHYSQRPDRDFVKDFKPLPEDAGAPVRMPVPRYISKRDRSFSPSNNGRQTHMNLPRRRSRSRSRMRSPPRAWHSHRERMFDGRRLSRSPDFRSEARMERTRPSFSKSTYTSGYGEGGYISPSRGRFSPQRNCRWVDDRDFADNNHTRRRRSPPPGRVFRRNQRFDDVGPSGRLKSNDYFRPVMQRPGRFTYMANGGRECKLESNYNDRSFDDNGDAGNMRRFLHNDTAGDEDSEAKHMNNEEKETRGEVPHNQGGEREDQKASKI